MGERAIGDELFVRDIGLLESALGRPKATVFGTDAYATIDLKAAALPQSLAGNHALVDRNNRNKRLALAGVIAATTDTRSILGTSQRWLEYRRQSERG